MPQFGANTWKFHSIDDLQVVDRGATAFDIVAVIAASSPLMREKNKDGYALEDA